MYYWNSKKSQNDCSVINTRQKGNMSIITDRRNIPPFVLGRSIFGERGHWKGFASNQVLVLLVEWSLMAITYIIAHTSVT